MISANGARPGMTILQRAAMNVDRAAVDRAEEKRAKEATEERIAFLYSRLFQNAMVLDCP